MYAGAATPATSVLPALVPGYKEQEPFAYDLDKAKSLLKEAGYEDGFEVEIIGDNSTQETKGMTFVMQQLKKVGIEVKVVPNEAATNAESAAEPEDLSLIHISSSPTPHALSIPRSSCWAVAFLPVPSIILTA